MNSKNIGVLWMTFSYKKFLLSTAFALACLPFGANALETKAKQAILMDFDTGTVLFEKNAEQPMPPASMSKLMTAYIIFDKLNNGSLAMDDVFTVSENAWRKGGAKTGSSTMFLKINDKVKLKDLLRGIIVQSGNDACIVAAENIAGSEKEFVEIANKKAEELGLTETHLVNSTGWPHPDHKMSPRDLAVLAQRLIRDFPEYYNIYSEKSFKYNGIWQENRNPLLFSMPGVADGIKTGHTSVSGYGLTASAKKDGRRLILVINGLKTMKERGQEAERLIYWGFRDFDNYTVLKKDIRVVSVPVWLGEQKTVAAVPEEDLILTLQKGAQKDIRAVVSYEEPLKAPIKKGQKIATLTLQVPERESIVVDLVAANDVKKLGYYGRLKETIKYLLFKEN
ncbi:MAG: D-alanyl-D-alanine carboxypeptidase family protein [Alphaproteobacteria bacterium]|jgi:D-alanyl-D-alanine carboxypeptidase (penicillin-binding protein 5/6)